METMTQAELVARGTDLLQHNITMRRQIIDQQRAELKAAEAALEGSVEHLANLERALLKAAAVEASGSLPVGTRVVHSMSAEHTGTVVESDGTGIAVAQDKTGTVTYGYGPGEWVVVE